MDYKRDTKPYHILLWGAWYDSHNIADHLLLLTITALIQSELKNVTFTVLTDSPKHIQTYMQAESSCAYEPLASRRQIVRVIRALTSADFFIIGGGVPYFQNLKQIAVITFLTGICKLFKTPYGNWCVSSQPVASAIAKRIFGWTLNGASFITLRDNHTSQLFKACGVKNQMLKCADSAFTFQPSVEGKTLDQIHFVGQRDITRPLIALMPRTLSGQENINQTHYTKQSEKEFQRELSSFSEALDWSWENGFQPIFIPMNTFGEDDDRKAAHLSIQKAKYRRNALLIDEEIRPQDAVRILNDCQASFSARVHGSILSAICGCPIMMYAFQPKHEGIMFEMGLEDYILKPENASSEATCLLLEKLVTNRDQIRKNLQTTINKLNYSARHPLQLLVKHLSIIN
jgi:polysaccharide pyruvyl transferase WcaK-like protein